MCLHLVLSFVPVLIGLATVAVAQNSTTDCITAFSSCYDFESSNGNVCSSQASTCKDKCAMNQSNCLSSGTSKAVCSSAYDACVGATSSSVVSLDCLASVIPCYTGDGSVDNTCDSKIGNCKTACSALTDICNSTENDNSELCQSKLTQCLGADKATAPSTSCIEVAENAYLNGTADNQSGSLIAQCKQTCGVLKDACLAGGDDSVAAGCDSAYLSCLGSDKLEGKTSKINCVEAAQTCYESDSSDNECARQTAQCKDICSNIYNTCNSSGDNSTDAGCLNWYSQCVGATTASSNSSIDCVSQQEQCYLDDSELNQCDADNAQSNDDIGKDVCSREFSTCLSTGDDSVKGQCEDFYLSCLGSSKLQKPKVDCVAENDACYLSGKFTDAECDAKNASLRVATHIILNALGLPMLPPSRPSLALRSPPTVSSRVMSQDTCLSSGDESVKPACQKHYDTCLGATPEAEKAASSINCVQRYTSCFSSGIEENLRRQLYRFSVPGPRRVYNSCLGSIATSLVDYKPLDCAGRSKLCASNGTASNECDRENASCTNACATTLDTCLVSGSSDTAACNHLYMMCLDSSSYTVTSIPASLKPTSSRASLSIIPSANATTKATGISAALTTGPASGAISTGGAFVSGPYNNGSSSTADAQSGAVSVATSTESTVYVTDVVKTTVTTCPVGFTLTTAGSTTVLATPSVITTSVTVKSTISTTVAHTVTVPAAGNNAIPSSKATPSVESTVYVTDVVKSTVTTCPVGQTVTASGSTTVLTAPSVMTSQITVKSTVSTVITHTAVVPQSSPVSPEQTTPASFAGHVAVPSTVTLYSTKQVTITSCAADVTNCPAKVSTTLFPTAITVTSVWSRTQSISAASSPAGSAPAGSAPAGSAPAGSAPAGSSPVSPETTSVPVTIPSTMFYYSTAVVTVTSCAEGVENCPARSTVVKTSVVPTGYAVTSVISSAWTPEAYTSASAGVPENSAPVASVPVSSAPVAAVPTTAPFAVNNSTMMSVGPTGTGIVGTGSGSKATSTFSPSQYTGAANKAGVAGLAGVAAFAAFLL
ncbi:hypothetical protein D6C84_04455 [Aureobasidium pullulans]|uniref:Extracellular membrane protein CFEM domain-containing protein n=1 Tax=Aureobasidium pullulans TaxID=5580 RepID=A0A4S9XV17_AURPU|nr:hypothetical protein D6C84_04455 [Aureobasidium pullulans]